jgi:hypothetical protein
MNENEEILRRGLKALAASETSAPPPGLEAALLTQLKLKQLKPKQLKKKPGRVISWPLALEALAAAAVIAIAISGSRAPEPVDTGFVPVPFVEPIGPTETAQVVRVRMPVGALAKWGIPVRAVNLNQSIDADVVLGEDGLARAVRFVQ